MSEQAEDPEAAADRLEAALERIARISAVRPAPELAPAVMERPDDDLSVTEIAERLDSLIARLRTALGGEAKTQ